MNTFEETIATANILIGDKYYSEAIQHYKDALEQTQVPELRIDIYNTMGRLYLSLNNTEDAISSFENSLVVHNAQPVEKAKALQVNKAAILNNLGAILIKKDSVQAIKHHKEALAIFKEAHKTDPKLYTLHLGNTHYSYADACYQKKDFYKAKKQYKTAIEIYDSVPESPNALPFIANSHYNLGNIYTDENNVYDARNNYLKALKTFRILAKEQPKAYSSLVAATYNNLAVTSKTMYKYDEALIYYENALHEYEVLKEQDKESFLPFYAATLNSIGIVFTEQHEVKDDYASMGLSGFSGFGTLSADNATDSKKEKAAQFQKEKAVEFYQRALEVYEDLTAKEPETYTHYVATCLHNLGVLHDSKQQYKQALAYFKKALNIRRFLSEKQAEAFNLDTCATLLNLTTLYQNLLEQTSDISLKKKSLKLLKEVEERLNIYGDSEKPIILSMKSDTQYFTKFFNEVNTEYLEVLDTLRKTNEIQEKIKETAIPIEKLQLQKTILNIIYIMLNKYPKNVRLQEEMHNTYTLYSWFALRSDQISIAEKAIENGLKVTPNSLVLKANQGHIYLVKGEFEKAKSIYLSLKNLQNDENENFKKVLKQDFEVLIQDKVLRGDADDFIKRITN